MLIVFLSISAVQFALILSSIYFDCYLSYCCFEGISSVNGTFRDDHSFNRSGEVMCKEVFIYISSNVCNKINTGSNKKMC